MLLLMPHAMLMLQRAARHADTPCGHASRYLILMMPHTHMPPPMLLHCLIIDAMPLSQSADIATALMLRLR